MAFKPFRYWQAAAAAAVVLIITGVWMFSLDRKSAPENQATVPVIAKTEEPQPTVSPSVSENKNIGADTVSAAPAEVTANTHHWHNENNKVVTERAKKAAPKQQDSYSYSTTTDANAPVTAASQDINNPGKYFDKPAKKELVSAEKKEATTENKVSGAPVVNDVAPYAGNRYANAAKTQEAKAQDNREPETELITIARSDAKAKRVAPKDKNLSGFIKGQVTDPFNNPVANAYVQVQLQKTANNHLLNNLTTDKWGYFKIPVSDSTVDVAINVSGYGTQNFTLQNNAALNQLQLQPANYSYNFYAPTAPVNGKKQQAGTYKFPNVTLYDAEPAYGWVAFGQYLEKTK